MTNLRLLLKHRLLQRVERVKGQLGAWRVLLCDEYTERMILYIFGPDGMNQVMEAGGIDMVDKVSKAKRKPFPHKEAIYIVQPTKLVVKALISDFKGVPVPNSPTFLSRYKHIHLLLTSPMPEAMQSELRKEGLIGHLTNFTNANDTELQTQMNTNKKGVKNIHAYNAFVMNVDCLDMDVIAPEMRLFHFDNERLGLRLQFHPDVSASFLQCLNAGMKRTDTLVNLATVKAWDADCSQIAVRLASMMKTMGEYPRIRYMASSFCSRRISELVQEELDRFLETHSNSYPARSMKERSVLLIVDRGHDPTAPFMHDFYYQAMVYDLLDGKTGDGYIEEDKYHYKALDGEGKVQDRSVDVNEEDEIWRVKRHMHIKDATVAIAEDFQQFLQDNRKLAILDKQGRLETLSEMNDALKQLPKYQEKKSMYSYHTHMADKSMDLFGSRQLAKAGNVEQDLACGMSPDGQSVSKKKLEKLVMELMAGTQLTTTEKLRLLLICAFNMGWQDKDFQKFITKCGADQFAPFLLETFKELNALHILGEKKKNRIKYTPETRPYDLSRWVPRIYHHVKALGADTLSEVEFPFISDIVEPDLPIQSSLDFSGKRSKECRRSLKTRKQPSWAAKEAAKRGELISQVATQGKRIIVFIVGGATYSEARTIYKQSEGTDVDVVLGTTAMIRPNSYTEHIRSYLNARSGHAA